MKIKKKNNMKNRKNNKVYQFYFSLDVIANRNGFKIEIFFMNYKYNVINYEWRKVLNKI